MPDIKVVVCRSCDGMVRPGAHHRCASKNFTAPKIFTSDEGTSDFLISFVTASVTNSTLLGYALGGSLSGAVLGDVFSPSDDDDDDDMLSDDPLNDTDFDDDSD